LLTDGPEPDVEDTTGRVTANLVGLWKFDDSGGLDGATITDSSGVTTVATPVIADPSLTTWLGTSLRIDSPTLIATTPTRMSLVDAIRETDAVTIEAWVTAGNDTQAGSAGAPARIVTIAPMNAGNHHFSIGQLNDQWIAHIRTSGTTDPNGGPALPLQPLMVGKSTHLVVTADASGRKFYVDGVLTADLNTGGTTQWDPNGRALVLAGDPTGQNRWTGTLHLVAIYNQALDETEVLRNRDAGP
jgi:hypothetical protein